MNRKLQLSQFATIQTGFFAKPLNNGDIVYLQAKHFDENGVLTSLLHPNIFSANISEKHILKPGDILFAAKGSKNFATLYESKNLPAIASTSFFVIRILENYIAKILPEFITWFINHPKTQEYLKGKAIGSSTPSISKSVLENLEIPIPNLPTQYNIIKIVELKNKGFQLKQQLESQKEKLLNTKLYSACHL